MIVVSAGVRVIPRGRGPGRCRDRMGIFVHGNGHGQGHGHGELNPGERYSESWVPSTQTRISSG
jgi:hypothetical protein